MRVVLYHPWIYLRSGVERMISELVRRSRHDWVLCTHHFEPEATYPALRDADVRVLSPEISVRRATGPLSRAALTIATAALPDVGAHALLVSSEGLGDLVLARNRLPAAAYCHTPLKIRHDAEARARLQRRDPGKARLARGFGPGFDLVDRALWHRYRHVLVNSAEVRARVARAGLRPSGPVEVLHPGVDTEWYAPGTGTREGLLVAGRIMWQKRIELAIDAYRLVATARAPDATPLEPLTVAGTVDVKSRPYAEELRERAHGLDVEFVTDPSDARLRELLRRARALVFTAPNEDFGMVMLEALACGTPVLAPGRGGPQEIVTPGAGWLVTDDVSTFAEHMDRILAGSVPSGMDTAARARSLEFDWDRFAARVDDVMEAITRAP